MHRRPLLPHALGLLLLAALPSTMAHAATPPPPNELSCRFQASREAAGAVMLHFTLRNTGTRTLHLLRWGSPFEGGWFGRFVRVSTPQGELAFQGAMRKRGDPSAADYLPLPPGQTLEATLALGDAYALPATGTLQLKAGWRWHDVMAGGSPPRPRAAHQGQDQDCGEVTLTR
ncbi:hypothetical protein DBR42_25100 [Pelomonas sp. HMWF004]|nr:hypothetical protein DBR42_25100 [Pelomonas sp. HMWF004]